MAAAPIVAVLAAAAEAYAKELAADVGSGIVETLFHQGEIAKDLDEIKRMIEALSDFIRTKLPALIEHSVDLAFARQAQYQVAEKARTIVGSIAALDNAIKVHAPQAQKDFIVHELAEHCDAILELGGTLIEYGQPYYSSVGIAFGAALNGYAWIVKEQPARAMSLRSLASNWKPRVSKWVDPARPTSLAAVLAWLQGRYALGLTCVPSFETWNTHTTREVAISWRQLGDGIFVSGAWFGYWQDRGLQGDTLGRWLPAGLSFDQAVAQGQLQYTIPEWWAVRADTPGTMDEYNQCAYELASLIRDYYSYAELAPPAISAVDVIQKTLEKIETILVNTEEDAARAMAEKPKETKSKTDAEKLALVDAWLHQNRPGIGVTRRF